MKYYDQPRYTYAPVVRTGSNDRKIGRNDLSPDQTRAFEGLLDKIPRVPFTSLGGLAGVGKSSVIPILSETLGDTDTTAFVAFTGKAANVMGRKLKAAGIQDAAYIGTIHGLIYRPKVDEEGKIVGWERRGRPLRVGQNADDPLSGISVSRIIVDEASMINEETFEDLLQYRVPVLLVGDHGQLPPVEGNSVLQQPAFKLEQIHRQAANNPIIRLAHDIRTYGDIPYDFPKKLPEIVFRRRDDLYEIVGETYERLGLNMSVIVRTNRSRSLINVAPRDVKEPTVGDLVICLRNNPPVFNGMRGTILAIEPCDKHWYHASIHFPDDGITLEGILNKYQFGREYTIESILALNSEGIKMNPQLPLGLLFDFGIALTCHKSQGSSWPEVIICPERWHSESDNDYKRWLYTGVTRAEKKLTIIT